MSTVSDSASEATAPGEQLPQRDGWEVKKVKHLFTSHDGKRVPLSAEERTNRQGEYPYYGASGIIDRVDSYIFDEDLLLVAEDGANLLNRASPVAFVASGKYWVNNHAHILKPFDGLLKFWAYRLEAVDLTPFVTGSAQPKLTSEALFNISIVVPKSIDDRSQICAFLDRETAQIDALIAKQERLIAVLQEKRQALISHAVTKGLNPAAPMKDSGVEWLGEVPAHWEVKRLKHIATIQTGVAKGRDLSDQETIHVPYMRVANVQDGYLDLDDVASIEIARTELDRYCLRPGDVLMNEGGDNDKLGRGHIWRGEIDPCIHQNHVFAVRPHGVEPEWLTLVTSTDYAKFYFFSVAKQSTNLASISSSNLREAPILCPPTVERNKICAYVAAKSAKYDQLLDKTNLLIEELKGRRSALISATVTGKIDMRE